MSLHFELCVNDWPIGRFSARRIAGGTNPDDINTYDVVVTGRVGPPNRDSNPLPIETRHATVEHRYGDHPLTLVRKGIEAVGL